MSQHFLHSPAARTLSIREVDRLSEQEAQDIFLKARFAANGGKPFCRHCGPEVKVYRLRETPIRWKCSKCRQKFSITSGTILANRKKPLGDYLSTMAHFAGGAKGVAALQMVRYVEFHPKSMFVLLHKLREVMGTEVHTGTLGGPGKIVEIDGTEFGDAERETNKRPIRAPRKPQNKRIVGVIRERRGRVMPFVLEKEEDLVPIVIERVALGTLVLSDEAQHWRRGLRGRFRMKHVRHKQNFMAKDGTHINGAESFNSRLDLSYRGTHHHQSKYRQQFYADEIAWRVNHCRDPNRTQWETLISGVLAHPVSDTWARYWQRKHRKERENGQQ
jgi:ribosomal protein L37AE/L43A